jgi:hypothetical protein
VQSYFQPSQPQAKQKVPEHTGKHARHVDSLALASVQSLPSQRTPFEAAKRQESIFNHEINRRKRKRAKIDLILRINKRYKRKRPDSRKIRIDEIRLINLRVE